MSQENLEIVRRVYGYWTRGDFRSGIEAFDPDVEFEIDATANLTGPVKVRGLAEMGKAWRESLSGWGDFRVGEMARLVEIDDGVIAFNRLEGRGRRSGIVVDQSDRAAIFRFRNNRIVGLRLTTATEAIEAAGLSE